MQDPTPNREAIHSWYLWRKRKPFFSSGISLALSRLWLMLHSRAGPILRSSWSTQTHSMYFVVVVCGGGGFCLCVCFGLMFCLSVCFDYLGVFLSSLREEHQVGYMEHWGKSGRSWGRGKKRKWSKYSIWKWILTNNFQKTMFRNQAASFNFCIWIKYKFMI